MTNVTLHTGDCLEIMASMEPNSVDATVPDPPYGLGSRMNGTWGASKGVNMKWDKQLQGAMEMLLTLAPVVAVWW